MSATHRIPATAGLLAPLLLAAGCDAPARAEVRTPQTIAPVLHEPADAAAAQPATPAGPRNVVLIIVDGMSYANEVGASWYTNGEADDTSLSFHAWPSRTLETTWDTTTWQDYAPADSAFDPAAFDPRWGYDPVRGGVKRLLRPGEDGREAYFLTQPLPAADGSLGQATQPSTDSASSATAMATGRKVADGVISEDTASGTPLETIGELLRRHSAGRAGYGAVSTVPFSHATPAAFLAHDAKRSHYIPLVDDILAARPDVVVGGGHPDYYSVLAGAKLKPFISPEQYSALKASPDWVFAERTAGQDGGELLLAAAQQAAAECKPLFGLFGGPEACLNQPVATGDPAAPWDMGTAENPDCWEIAHAALTVLSDPRRFPDGFMLMIEQGDVDWANHAGNWAWGLGAMHDADECARQVTAWLAEQHGTATLDNTLVLLVPDHSHYLRLGEGYPQTQHALPEGSGKRPEKDSTDPYWRRVLPGRTVWYSGPLYHSNELVALYATGAQALPGGPDALLAPYLGKTWGDGPGVPGVVDDTAVFGVMRDWLGLGGE
jgi:alkaline phosphatase